MKLVVQYEPQKFEYEINDGIYADFLNSGEDAYHYFDSWISDTDPDFTVRVEN